VLGIADGIHVRWSARVNNIFFDRIHTRSKVIDDWKVVVDDRIDNRKCQVWACFVANASLVAANASTERIEAIAVGAFLDGEYEILSNEHG